MDGLVERNAQSPQVELEQQEDKEDGVMRKGGDGHSGGVGAKNRDCVVETAARMALGGCGVLAAGWLAGLMMMTAGGRGRLSRAVERQARPGISPCDIRGALPSAFINRQTLPVRPGYTRLGSAASSTSTECHWSLGFALAARLVPQQASPSNATKSRQNRYHTNTKA